MSKSHKSHHGKDKGGKAKEKEKRTSQEELPNLGGLMLSSSPNSGTSGLVSGVSWDVEALRKEGLAQVEGVGRRMEGEACRVLFRELPLAIGELDVLCREDERCLHEEEAVVAAAEAALGTLVEEWKKGPEEGGREKDAALARRRAAVGENGLVRGLTQAMQPLLLRMAAAVGTIAMWIKLRVPELESGDNFGVEVQGEILSALDAAQDSYLGLLGDFSAYHEGRAEAIKLLMDHPGLQDSLRLLQQLDARTYLKLQLAVADLRNEAVTIFDLLCKNMSMLGRPKSAPSTSSYL